MLSKKLRTVLAWVLAIMLILLALFFGFKIGYGFILDQDAKAEAIASVSRQREISSEDPAAKSTDALIGATSSKDSSADIVPLHVKKDTPGAVEIYISYGDGSAEVADKLKHEGIIEETTAYTVIAKINGYDGKYQRGTHFVLPGMNYNEIMYNLSLPPETTWVTFPEGSAYVDMKRILRENGVNFDEKVMDQLVDSPSNFTQYSFISQIPTDNPDRVYDLEGYLFPDTYQFDLNASEEEIINTLLRNTENKLNEDILARTKSLGYSLDQVITLASIIQAESGNIVDQYKISRVFHNRLNEDWNLESDATINYVLKLANKKPVMAVSKAEQEIDSKYNTYKNTGLTPGPIGNPGLNAIQAALYPDTDDLYIYYFVSDGEGGTVFARTYEEHQANVAKYRDKWTQTDNSADAE